MEHQANDLAVLAAAVQAWHDLGGRYADQVRRIGHKPSATNAERTASIDQLIRLGDLRGARDLVVSWLRQELGTLTARSTPETVIPLDLLRCLADVVEHTSDQPLLEMFWGGLAAITPPPTPEGMLPLVGVPVLNRPDLLERLISSLDVPVGTLAIVDNSGGRDDQDARDLRRMLDRLERDGRPGIQRLRVARAFGNGGVATSWNQILQGFPDAPLALIVNNDVAFPPGLLAAALQKLDPKRAQFLPLLPEEQAFSAFMITALTWDRIGLFDDSFHPAYCEDLDYRDRLLASDQIEVLDGGFAHPSMSRLNPEMSATVASDPGLAEANRRSFQYNRLWYLHRRRQSINIPGHWLRRWLTHWRS